MPVPTFTDETHFASYLTLVLGRGVMDDLGIDTPALLLPVHDALLDYGVTDIAAATNLQKLRALGKVRAWEYVASEYAAQYRVSSDNQTAERQQKWDHAKAMLANAKADVTTMITLELSTADAEAGFDWAEIVTGPFSARERLVDEVLRGG